MTDPAISQVIEDLRELIAALDRRIPRLERPTEAGIAVSAKVLRDKALRHIEALQQADAVGAPSPDLTRSGSAWRCGMGDKGKKDKEKGQKQHAAKDKEEERRKQQKQPKRTA